MIVGSLTFTRSSSNIANYGEGLTPRQGRVWVSVIRVGWHQENGQIVADKVPTFGFRVNREGVGQVASFDYKPKTRPKDERLPDRTVTRLVRQHLAEVGDQAQAGPKLNARGA